MNWWERTREGSWAIGQRRWISRLVNSWSGEHPAVRSQLTFIAETPPIPNDGACAREGLAPEFTERLKAALLSLNDPVGTPLLKRLYVVDGLVEDTDADFDPVREAADLLGLTPPKR